MCCGLPSSWTWLVFRMARLASASRFTYFDTFCTSLSFTSSANVSAMLIDDGTPSISRPLRRNRSCSIRSRLISRRAKMIFCSSLLIMERWVVWWSRFYRMLMLNRWVPICYWSRCASGCIRCASYSFSWSLASSRSDAQLAWRCTEAIQSSSSYKSARDAAKTAISVSSSSSPSSSICCSSAVTSLRRRSAARCRPSYCYGEHIKYEAFVTLTAAGNGWMTNVVCSAFILFALLPVSESVSRCWGYVDFASLCFVLLLTEWCNYYYYCWCCCCC